MAYVPNNSGPNYGVPIINNEYTQPIAQPQPFSNNIAMLDNPILNQPPPGAYYSNYQTGPEAPLLQNSYQNYSLEALECFEDLGDASEAIINKYLDSGICSNCSCCIIPRYQILIESKNKGFKRQIFLGRKQEQICNNNRSFKIKVKYIPRDTGKLIINIPKNEFEKSFFEINYLNNGRGTNNVPIQVIGGGGTFYGNIRQPNSCQDCCCSDPDYQIYSIDNFNKYRITTDGCQCSYCCCDGCCCQKSAVEFQIYNSNKDQIVGKIIKSEFFSMNQFLNYKISFPNDATPEEKILIISSVIAIDNFKFLSLG